MKKKNPKLKGGKTWSEIEKDKLFNMLMNYRIPPLKPMSSAKISPNTINPGQVTSTSTSFSSFSGASTIGGNFFDDDLVIEDKRLILFYGFNGMLAQKYSVIEDMTREEITVRMELAKNKVNWKIESYDVFTNMVKMFAGTPNALLQISFDDAMNTIRVGIMKAEEVFEDAEEEEFDDDCLSTCKPGAHLCGK